MREQDSNIAKLFSFFHEYKDRYSDFEEKIVLFLLQF